MAFHSCSSTSKHLPIPSACKSFLLYLFVVPRIIVTTMGAKPLFLEPRKSTVMILELDDMHVWS